MTVSRLRLKALCVFLGIALLSVACSPVENPAAAIPHYSETLAANPNDGTALINRCAHYTASAQYQNAVADCTLALRLQPNSVSALQNRAAAYQRWGRLREALADWEQVLAQIEGSEFWRKNSPERIDYARLQVTVLHEQLENGR